MQGSVVGKRAAVPPVVAGISHTQVHLEVHAMPHSNGNLGTAGPASIQTLRIFKQPWFKRSSWTAFHKAHSIFLH
jgi:hypothetical protein